MSYSVVQLTARITVVIADKVNATLAEDVTDGHGRIVSAHFERLRPRSSQVHLGKFGRLPHRNGMVNGVKPHFKVMRHLT
jgi:hypothetical protein